MAEPLIGIIADFYGLLRPQALQALAGVESSSTAVTSAKPKVRTNLWRLTPVPAVRGNTDRGDWTAALPHTRVVEIDGLYLYISLSAPKDKLLLREQLCLRAPRSGALRQN